MLEIRMNKGETAYDAVSKIIMHKYGDRGESIVVQLRQKYDEFDPWEELTVLLINDPIDPIHSKYVWETDWWFGQEIVELLAAAPISKIRLDDNSEFRFVWESEFYDE